MKKILERVPQNKLFMRIGLFTADNAGEKGNLKIEAAVSGASIVFDIEDPDWKKNHKGEISPYRYKLTPEKLVALVLEEYKAHKKDDKGNK